MRPIVRFQLVCLAVLITSVCQRATAQFSTGADGRYQRVVLIRYSPELLRLDTNLLDSVLHEELVSRALQKALPDRDASEVGLINVALIPLPSSGDGLGLPARLFFQTNPDVEKEAAAKIANAIRTELEEVLGKMQATNEAQLKSDRERRLGHISSARDVAESELRRSTDEYIELRVRNAYSAESTQSQIEAKRAQQREYEMQLAGYEARRRALEDQVDKIRAVANEELENDELIDEMRAIIAIREKIRETVHGMHQAGQATAEELLRAEDGVAQAKIELLRARRAAVGEASAKQLATLNNELNQLAAQEAEVRIFVRKSLEHLAELREELGLRLRAELKIERVQQQMELRRERAARLTKQQAELDEEFLIIRGVQVIPWGN